MCRCAAAIATAVVAFLDAVIVGCLRSCFRGRPRRGSGRRGAIVHRDRAAEVLWDDELGLGRSGGLHEDSAEVGEIVKEELRREANYLKLCGTISETPAELRYEQSYESNLENTNECDNRPMCGLATKCKSPFETNSSEGCEEPHKLRSELNKQGASAFLEKSPFQNIQHGALDCNGSPFPTPLVLRDDMQTPGTVYASHRGASISAKHVRTRKQFIYPVLRPIENRLQQVEHTDSIKDPTQTPSASVVKSGLPETPSSFSAPQANASYQVKEALSPEELLDGKELPKPNSDEKNAALSLSHWLKSSSTDAENQGDDECSAGDHSYDECTFLTERPVVMASDLNCDTENPTPRLPKTWVGNGIPNTTTKYKEDQRINWHTTPFEERLLKVLSDEENCPPRKVVRGKLFHPEQKAE